MTTGFTLPIQVVESGRLSAWLVVALTLVTLWLVRGNAELRKVMLIVLCTVLLQGAIGYIQYFLGVPAVIVALHMVGLSLLTAAVSWPLVITSRSTHADQPGADAPTAVRAS